MKGILSAWSSHLEESFSFKEVQFKTFCPGVKRSFPPAENINEAADGGMLAGVKFLTKLWCCIGGEYYKIIWFYQLG